MTAPLPRPVPRWLHVWAVLAVASTLVLLAVGQLVTSFGAGMADRVWPTEPWYVLHTATETEKARFKEEFGFFIEHSHRIAGYTIGVLVTVLVIGIWLTEPRKTSQWVTLPIRTLPVLVQQIVRHTVSVRGVALAGLFTLLFGYGEFHRGLMAQRQLSPESVRLPLGAACVAFIGLMITLTVAVSGMGARLSGSGLRFLATLALTAVMIQGLLGGFRVKLNELVGTDLAAFHGVFAQVVFGLLVTIAVLTARPTLYSGPAARRLRLWASGLAHLVLLQVVFGALVRHYPLPLSQRLHFLTAFAATAVAVLVLRAVLSDPAARRRAGAFAWALAALIAAQLYLGVEAWMAKFGQYVPPEMVKVTAESGAIRTLHALVGSGVWAVSLAMAVRLRPVIAPAHTLEPNAPWQPEAVSHATALAPEGAASRFRGDV